MARYDNLRLRFGEYLGVPLKLIPAGYLDWLIGQDGFRDPLLMQITHHLEDRSDWHALDDGDDKAPAVAVNPMTDVDVCTRCAEDLTADGYCKACGTFPLRKS